MKRLLRYLFLFFNVLLAVPLLISYLVPLVNTGYLWYGAILGLFYPFLLFANVLFIVFWLVFYKRYLLVSLLCIAVGFQIHNNYIQLFGKTTTEHEGIKVLTYNVNHFYKYLEREDDIYTMLDFIEEQNADIICLQETKLQRTGELNPARLKERFPGIVDYHSAHQSAWHGPVTFSAYPIIKRGEIRFDDTFNLIIYSDMLIDGDTIRVYNCHLQSFGIRPDDYSVIDTLGFQPHKIEEMRLIGGKLRNGYTRRAPQVDSLRRHIELCSYPVIVSGDFNDTPVSNTYYNMQRLLNDAFVESGVGISNTYRGKLPSYRIDYIFYSSHFNAYNYRRHRVEYSDHYPVSTLLVPAKK